MSIRLHPLPLPQVAALASALGIALTATVPVHAADDGTTRTLDAIVVTATGFEQKLTDAPASISIVTREQIAQRPYASLTDILRDIEGVDVDMEGSNDKNGMGYVSMRGMPADYTLVLVDGRRQSNIGDIYPNYYGSGQSGFIPPLDAIERVEVVRGPMSTLYGSDAMGGVINIITRKSFTAWTGSAAYSHTFQQEDRFGDNDKLDLYLSGPLLEDRLGLTLRASGYDRDAASRKLPSLPLPSPPNPDDSVWDRTISEGRSSAAATNWNAGIRLSFAPGEDHDFLLDYDTSRQEYDNSGTQDTLASLWRVGNNTIPNPAFDPALPESTTNPATITRRTVMPRGGYAEKQRYEREQLAFTHIGRWSFGTTTSSLMRNTNRNLGRTMPLMVDERLVLQDLWNAACVAGGAAPYCAGAKMDTLTPAQRSQLEAFLPRPLRTLEIRSWVLDTMLDMQLGNHKLTIGGQYQDAQMEDSVFGMYGDGFVSGTYQPHRQWAAFAEDNWQLADSLTFTYGLRHDHHNMFGQHLSPRGYLVWNSSEHWTLKGGVSTGYKTPKPNQLFEGINGFWGQGDTPVVGNPQLTPETSTNFELAAYYDNRSGFNANATVFLNRFKDKIATADTVRNCEIAAPGEHCVEIGAGWADLGFLVFNQDVNVDRAQSRGVELAAQWQPSARWSLRGNYTYTESENKTGTSKGLPIAGLVTSSISTPARHMANASLEWKASERISLSLAAEGRYHRYRGVSATTGEHLYYADHTLLHLGGNWRITDRFSFSARINNLLDKDYGSQTCELTPARNAYSCFDDYLLRDQRRSLWTSLVHRF
ncbi:MAG: TonB-dependent receptor [Stenotrophomonas sp.]